ncbi:superfamily II DNA/RNA helicase [Mycobacterium frederiksbergense]|uniref:Superfamily II DNA/RNA helicase n=1 Tax=Mycolicibacterium frederiksbergense TaxID=117567 RepID=A0ABT6L5Z4_9MYCO|nr:DEAD/DEAH box helicase [Mycolicibacterium frederiksbergense]MDH6197755.1 superfamily II DNA/RNA helicase [Mycolicibacterium frederiksbergense]
MSAQEPAHTAAQTTFADLGLPAEIVAALAANGVMTPFPIQAATLPDSLTGRDVLGRGRTGSGKTYAFLLPLVARLSTSGTRRTPNRPRALILAPTRELVTQIEASLAPLAAATGLRSINVFGGVSPGPQIAALQRGVDIVIACPGRLEDHMKSGHVDLSAVEITVLDEADHMADLGFLPGVKRLLDRTPKGCQRLLFSATLDAGVDVLVDRYLHDPVVHSVDSAQSPVAAMVHHVLHVDNAARINVVADLAAAPGRTIVFARTKHGAKNLTRQLNSRGISAVELHGNLSQNARTRNLTAFSDGSATVMVATDIAARGIHVDEVSLVVHADPPVEHKAYLHRSGRTARAGAEGTVVTLMHDAQVSDVRSLTRKAGVKPTITRVKDLDHPVLREIAPGERVFGDPIRPEPAAPAAPARRQPGNSGQQRRTRPGGSGRSGAGSGRSGAGSGRSGAPAARNGAPAARSGSNGQRGGQQRGGGRRPSRPNDSGSGR